MLGGVIGLVALTGFLFWLLRGRESSRPAEVEKDELSYEDMEAAQELKEAEEEVRDQDSSARPDDEQPGDDWGPGTAKSY